MKKLLFLGACLVALASSPVMAQTGGTDVVVVRITEEAVTVYVSVTQADGRSEQWKFVNGSTGKRLDESGQGYHKLLAGLYQQGYHLQSTFSGNVGPADVSRVTMIFVKDK
jgi:hypothetical protein